MTHEEMSEAAERLRALACKAAAQFVNDPSHYLAQDDLKACMDAIVAFRELGPDFERHMTT